MKRAVGLAALSAACLAPTCPASPLWADSGNLTGLSNDFLAAAYGDDLFVAVGSQGTIFTSTNANPGTWQSAIIMDTNNDLQGVTFQGVAYGQSLFVVVGNDDSGIGVGTLGYSTDGLTWQASNYTNASGFTSVAYGVAGGKAQFVAVGLNGAIITSLDGTNWAPASYSTGTSETNDDLFAVTYGDGRFVAVGFDDASFSWSGTGEWSQGGTAGGQGVVYGDNQFVSVDGSGNIFTSPDGVAWTMRASTGAGDGTGLGAVTHGNGMFLAVGSDGTIVVSLSGLCNWTQIESDTIESLYGVAFGNGTFLAVGFDGIAISSMLPGVSATLPQMNWSLGPNVTNDLIGMTYNSADGLFVAVAGSASFSSANGIQWPQSGSGLESADLTAVASGNTRFVAVDSSGSTYTSSDGMDWTFQPGNGSNLLGVAYGAGTFVAVGQGGYALTASSVPFGNIPWISVNSGVSQDLNAVAYGNGLFVAVGAAGTITTSYDLGDPGTWTVQDSGTNANLYGVAYGGGYYVAVGLGGYSAGSGTILTSKDGQTWTPANYNASDDALRAVAYGNGLFVAVGDNGWTALSRDGTNWVGESSATSNNLESIVYNNGTFIAVGNDGTIMESVAPTPTIAPTLNPLKQITITVTGGPNQPCEIQDTARLEPALANWKMLATITLSDNGTGQYTDPTPATSGSRFYRAIAIPGCQ